MLMKFLIELNILKLAKKSKSMDKLDSKQYFISFIIYD